MNPVVDALNALSIFRPSQAGAYREHGDAVRKILGADIPTKAQARVTQWAESGSRGTLILTGNAGTGKTALVETYCRALGVPPPAQDGISQVAPGRYVVKDFSGLQAKQRPEVLRLEKAVRCGETDAQLLVCANEGVLRAAIEAARRSDLEAEFDRALRDGVALPADECGTAIWNMNRQRWTDPVQWGRLLDYMVREDLWRDCEGCPAKSECPINANAAALRRESPREATRRLTQLASSNVVATLRELLAILANAITGGLSCHDVRNAERTFTATESYFNWFFGDNLEPSRRERSYLLQAIREVGVGEAADAEVDGWLRDAGTAPPEVREFATDRNSPLSRVRTRIGDMSFSEFGETITVSDDPVRVAECLKDFAEGANVLALWRRRIFMEAQPFLGGRTAAFRRLTWFTHFGELLDMAEAAARGDDLADQRQELIVGMNYLVAGLHAAGELVVPDAGSLAARNPGSFVPSPPAAVHDERPFDDLRLSLEDGPEVQAVLDTDGARMRLSVDTADVDVQLPLTSRLFQAIMDSCRYRAPIGADIPEMTEIRSFYARLASGAVPDRLRIVDPIRGVIRPVTLPSLGEA